MAKRPTKLCSVHMVQNYYAVLPKIINSARNFIFVIRSIAVSRRITNVEMFTFVDMVKLAKDHPKTAISIIFALKV